MAVYYNKDIRWYVGAMSVACHAKSATLSSSCEALDTTALCDDGWVELIGGNKSGTFDMSLMSDVADDGLDERLWSYLGVADTPQSFSIGSADGSPGYTMKSLSTQYVPVNGPPGGLAMASLSGTSSGAIARGMLIHPDTTARTSSGTGTAWQVGALSSSQRLYAGLHVISASGTTPTLAVKVQSDTVGFGSATDRITFSTATDVANREQFSSVAGAITDDYWRVSYTIGGTTPSFQFAVIVGIG